MIRTIITETWGVAAEMAPYLLFGFLVAGLLAVFLSPAFVERHLGRPGFTQVFKAALMGVPLPLCSCGVLPVSVSLRQHGASKGATLSFLVSTPQTGVDSVLATHALMGPVFAVFRVVAAFVTGIVAGAGLNVLARGEPDEAPAAPPTCPRCGAPAPRRRTLRQGLRYGFVTLPRDIGRAMLLGILLSGLLTAVVPENYFADRLGPGIISMVVMMLVGIPLYVCSTGSIPIAYAFMRMGVTPGAALVFLIAGPATNAAAMTTVWSTLGRKAFAVYMATIALGAIAAGLVLDRLMAIPAAGEVTHVHPCSGPAWWQQGAAVLLMLILLPALKPKRRGRS